MTNFSSTPWTIVCFYSRFIKSTFTYWLNGTGFWNLRLFLKVSNKAKASHPQLIKLIIQCDDMDWNRERQYWLDRLDGFTAKQADQLFTELTDAQALVENLKQAFFATMIMTYPFLEWRERTLTQYWNIRVFWGHYLDQLKAAAKQMYTKEKANEAS